MTPSPSLAGRVGLVTGGSGGIGAALARRLAEAGVAVAVHYARHGEEAEEVAASIRDAGGRAVTIGADLEDPQAPDDLVDRTREALGPVDLLVANAGHGGRATLEEVDAATFDLTLAVNLRGPFLLARRVLPGMCERRFGRVLFTSSVAAFIGGVVGPHYAASKAGLHGLTHYLAAHAASAGVTVNAIAPALISGTRMLPGDPEELAARIPLGRLGDPDEVADLAVAVLSNAYLTSQVVSVDGGLYPR